MNIITSIIIFFILLLVLILLTVYVIYWMRLNNIFIEFIEFKDGVLWSTGGRYRLKRFKVYEPLGLIARKYIGSYFKLYFIRDLFNRKPLDVKDFNLDKFIATEGMPFIGVKKTLKLYKFSCFDSKGYKVWHPPSKFNVKSIIKPTRIAWVSQTREDLFESTKNDMTRKEMLSKMVIPISLIVLALACLIFFPKMYDAVLSSGNNIANTAIDRFSGFLETYIPLG
jgi:hypothetical protein